MYDITYIKFHEIKMVQAPLPENSLENLLLNLPQIGNSTDLIPL